MFSIRAEQSKTGRFVLLTLTFILVASLLLVTFNYFNPSQKTHAAVTNNYAEALQKSLYFYDAEKSGPGITGGRLQWRGDSEVADQAIPLKPMSGTTSTTITNATNLTQQFIDTYHSILDPAGKGTVDLHGGFHDAGDHVKFGLPQAYAASTLGWGLYEFKDAFVQTNQYTHTMEIVRWFSDYFLRSTFRDTSGNVIAFAYQVGEGSIDHNYWGPPELQSPLKFPRPAYFATAQNPGSDVSAQAAAALAVMYLNTKDSDPIYAAKCLDTAKALYSFAVKYRGLGYSGGFYGSSGDEDDLSWAAVWLYLATNTNQYITDINATDATGHYTGYMKKIIASTTDNWQNIWVHSWDVVWGGVFLKLAPITNNPRDWYFARWNLEYWSGIPHQDPADTTFLAGTPAGFKVVSTWGSARYDTSAQLCALVYRKYTGRTDFSDWAKGQMDYIMGANPMNRSYIVGYGTNYAMHPHHRASHGSTTNSMLDPTTHRHTLWGGLVGGPDTKDFHEDVTTNFVDNEVAVDYSAAFVGALAGLYTYYGQGQQPLANFPPLEPVTQDYYTQAKIEQENTERTQITLTIHNDSADPPHFETGMSVRYYFNISELLAVGQNINNVSLQIMYDEEKTSYEGAAQYKGPIAVNAATGLYYVEFGWSGYQVHGTRQLQFALIASQDSNFHSNWNPANDWSHQGLITTTTTTQYMPVYLNGKLVFGQEPMGIVPSPTPGGPTLTPAPTQPATPTPMGGASLKAQYKSGDPLAPNDSQLKPFLQIINTGGAPVALSDIKARYWYTEEGTGGQTYNCDYAVSGCASVIGTFHSLTNLTTTADTYLEVGFTSAAGNLGPGASTGELKNRVNKNDWTNFTESNDYSYDGTLTTYTDWTKVTLYYKGNLVWGSEPGGIALPTPTSTLAPTPTKVVTSTSTLTPTPTKVITSTSTLTPTPTKVITSTSTLTPTPTKVITSTSTLTPTPTKGASLTPTKTANPTTVPGGLKLQYKVGDAGAPNDNQIKPQIILFNSGTTPLNLAGVKIRYWFTEDGTVGQNYNCDYASQGCAGISGTFVHLATPRPLADTYVEISFAGGSLAAGANTGEIQSRLNKNDWSNYSETNDYSYNGTMTAYGDWTKVTAYISGNLVWGIEP